MRGSKKTSKLRVTGLCVGNFPVTGEFPHKGPVTHYVYNARMAETYLATAIYVWPAVVDTLPLVKI